MRYMGMEERVALTRVARPALLRKTDFQLASLDSFFFFLKSTFKVKPRYFPNSVVLEMPKIEQIHWAFSGVLLVEKNTLDLEVFMFRPDSLLK